MRLGTIRPFHDLQTAAPAFGSLLGSSGPRPTAFFVSGERVTLGSDAWKYLRGERGRKVDWVCARDRVHTQDCAGSLAV